MQADLICHCQEKTLNLERKKKGETKMNTEELLEKIETLREDIKKVENKNHNLNLELEDIKLAKNPTLLFEHLQRHDYALDRLDEKIDKQNVKLQRVLDEELVEIVKEGELRVLWVNSGLTLKEIAGPMNTDISTVSKLINDKSKDIQKRIALKKFLKNEIVEKNV